MDLLTLAMAKKLPEALQFGEMPTGGDTLYWDGNTEGLLEVTVPNLGTFYKVSDVALTKEDVYCEDGTDRPIVATDAQGFQCYANDEIAAMTADIVQSASGETISLDPYEYPLACIAEFVICVFEDNCNIGVFNFHEKGVYFASFYDVHSFYLLNCTKFPIVKQIDPKYLPTYGVFLDLGEFSAVSGDIPNWNDDLKYAIVTAFERGEPVRCMFKSGGSRYIYQAVELYPTGLECVRYVLAENKHVGVALDFKTGVWNHIIVEEV